jgi:hypothetical protein
VTDETSGGRIEHEVYTAEGILLQINELNSADGMDRSEKDNFAQVVVLLTCTSSFSLPMGACYEYSTFSLHSNSMSKKLYYSCLSFQSDVNLQLKPISFS